MDNTKAVRQLRVSLEGDKTYPILIGSGILEQCGQLIACVHAASKILLVSNPLVFSLYGDQVVSSLQSVGMEVHVYLMPDGEEHKTLKQAENILDQAMDIGLERSSLIAALGGGVVGDLAGFAAAIFQRGIPYIQVPTTLLSQVDSSVGGKTAVNHPRGKNMLGAFHQPRMVIIDINTLDTLEEREYRSGLGEVIKYGIIYDEHFFAFLENQSPGIHNKDRLVLQEMVYQCLRIKSEIVGQDEKELGLRMILNLGHTFGHSLEKLGQYRDIKHGEAVAMGTMAATELAVEMDLVTASQARRIAALFEAMGIPTCFPAFPVEEIYKGMLNDKKVKDAKLRIIVPRGIGSYALVDDPASDRITSIIEKAIRAELS